MQLLRRNVPFSAACSEKTKTSSTTPRGGPNVVIAYRHIMMKKRFTEVAFIEKNCHAERFPSGQKRPKKILEVKKFFFLKILKYIAIV